MNRIFLALATAATLGAALPAAALPTGAVFPTLTYPPHTAPQTTQTCINLTRLTNTACQPSK